MTKPLTQFNYCVCCKWMDTTTINRGNPIARPEPLISFTCNNCPISGLYGDERIGRIETSMIGDPVDGSVWVDGAKTVSNCSNYIPFSDQTTYDISPLK